MSWYISSIGKPSNVAAHIAAQVETQCGQSHNSEVAKSCIRASGEVAKAFCAQAPANVFVKANLSGHLDQHSGSTRVELEILTGLAPEAAVAETPPPVAEAAPPQ